jgi:mycofactocin precursor
MADTAVDVIEDDQVVSDVEPREDDAPLIEDLLVEEISIDGMCGVY